VVLVDAVYAGAPDRLGRDDTYPFEVSEGLLDCAKTVSISERVNASPRERRTRAQQHGEHGSAGSGHQAAEGLTKVHMTRILIM
jgi:hypothetical protein